MDISKKLVTTLAACIAIICVGPGLSVAQAAQCAGKEAKVVTAKKYKGTSKSDVVVGSGKGQVFRMRGGNDIVCAKGGKDLVKGGAGRDALFGGKRNDQLFGNGGNDLLSGEQGRNDDCRGGSGRNIASSSCEKVSAAEKSPFDIKGDTAPPCADPTDNDSNSLIELLEDVFEGADFDEDDACENPDEEII